MGSLRTPTAPPRARGQGWVVIACLFVPLVTAGIELFMGRSPLGPDGKFGLWEGDIWSAETSQRLADPYSFSHFIHGILFYAGFWLLARKLPRSYRLLAALLLEAGWELLENSPLIINRYRETTIALGYVGDSVLNSVSDILMMTLGFLFASRVPPKICVATILVLEIGCALWVRDNLTLNIIMLIYPVAAIKQWQLANAPVR